MKEKYTIFTLALIGLADSLYLSYKHFYQIIPPCSTSFFSDCGGVLTSKYSFFLGVPLAYIGVLQYSFLAILALLLLKSYKQIFAYLILILSYIGLIASLYFVYLQLVPIGAICSYCMVSAVVSFILFYLINRVYSIERKILAIKKTAFLYKYIIKNLLFLIDPEIVHEKMTSMGQTMGKVSLAKKIFKFAYLKKHDSLKQTVSGIDFENPVGLAAGFDYNAQLTQILPSIGFGFGTVGTITNMAYQGNPKPRLGRLPRSKSLMVNKGFKNKGAKEIAKKLKKLEFSYPVGVSIGRTNSPKVKTLKDSIRDIVKAFQTFESSGLNNSYYELNISCPNLIHSEVNFYAPKNLSLLLTAVDKLNLKKPIYVKMPIEKSDKEVLEMLNIISKHSPVGVIFGNLQKDRSHMSLDREEVGKFSKGYFSGKPTFVRSNELISLTYKNYKKRFVIIGCGGIFNGVDAYEKITRGATLVQLITGMIFEGPQLASQINFELNDLLKKNGYSNIAEAVGTLRE